MKPKNTGIQNPKGYMLVEALISIAIFSVGFLAVATLVLSVSRNNTSGNQLTEANMLAKAKLEMLKAENIESDALKAGDYADALPINADGDPGGIYTRIWTIQDALGFNTSREIKVTVNWASRGRNRSIVLSTITKGNGT
jgi:type II secretory pathway pseudopilin PulG